MKLKRSTSFIFIIAVYIAASVVGIEIYGMVDGSMPVKLLIADIAATAVTFIFSLIFRNSSVYDPYWSVQPIVILAAFAFAERLDITKLLLLFAVILWGVRLTCNWAYTFKGMEHQDWRYSMLKEKTGVFYPVVNFLGIHLFPTLVVYLCTLPAVYVVTGDAEFDPLCIIPLITAVGAVVLQTVADLEMQKYRRNRTLPFIRAGLWKYSRHPNYLGEIIMWWSVSAYSVILLGFEWYLALGAAINMLMFLFVSIPMADKRQSSKEGFAEYKNSTRMLLPIKK